MEKIFFIINLYIYMYWQISHHSKIECNSLTNCTEKIFLPLHKCMYVAVVVRVWAARLRVFPTTPVPSAYSRQTPSQVHCGSALVKR